MRQEVDHGQPKLSLVFVGRCSNKVRLGAGKSLIERAAPLTAFEELQDRLQFVQNGLADDFFTDVAEEVAGFLEGLPPEFCHACTL